MKILLIILIIILLTLLAYIISLKIININKNGGGFTGNQLYDLFNSQYSEVTYPECFKSLNIFRLSNLNVYECNDENDNLLLSIDDANFFKDKIAPNLTKELVKCASEKIAEVAPGLKTTVRAVDTTARAVGSLALAESVSSLSKKATNTVISNLSSGLFPQTINYCLNNKNFSSYVDYKITDNSSTDAHCESSPSDKYSFDIDPASIRFIAIHKGTDSLSSSHESMVDWYTNIDNLYDTSKYTMTDRTVDNIGAISTFFSNGQHQTEPDNIATNRIIYYKRRHISMLGHRAIKLLLKNLYESFQNKTNPIDDDGIFKFDIRTNAKINIYSFNVLIYFDNLLSVDVAMS